MDATKSTAIAAKSGYGPNWKMIGTDSAVIRPPPKNGSNTSCL